MASSSAAAAAAPPAFAAPATNEAPLIRVLNPHDVLLGRGLGPSKFEGNVKFRAVVATRKTDYNATDSYNEKARIGKEVFDVINGRGGRFLKLVRTENNVAGKPPRDVVQRGVWKEATRKCALEKCKQSLREKHIASAEAAKVTERVTSGENKEEDFREDEYDELSEGSGCNENDTSASSPPSGGVVPDDRSPSATNGHPSMVGPSRASSSAGDVLPDTLMGNARHSTASDPRLLLFQQPLPSLQHEHVAMIAHLSNQEDRGERRTVEQDEQDAVIALTSLALSGRPRFTEEQEIEEQSSMTDAERVAALCDVFGKCSVADTHQDKRARKDLDRESLDFLIGQMRLEMESIPAKKKEAFVKARAKCQPEEFSDRRLETFLRVEGMNTKTAAERFVYYWVCRRELFGPDKYLLPMTLNEALRDDVAALEAGVYRLLPRLDSSGRQLVLLEPRKNTGEGYTAESLLRAMWYTAEVASQECRDVGSGFVYIGWTKDCSVWDFGAKVYGRLSHYETCCWPIRFVAAHMCGTQNAVSRIMSPVLKALMDRRGRSRMLLHSVTEKETVEVLSPYGIKRHMIPVHMGGTVCLCQKEWLAGRRAAEMEEL